MADEAGICRFCGGPDTEDDQPTNSGTCGSCYYGMRLDPEEWERELKAKGRTVIHRGGCIVGDGMIVCRDPYAPGLTVMPGGRK